MTKQTLSSYSPPSSSPEPFLRIEDVVQFRAEVCGRESVRVIRLAGRLEQAQTADLIRLCDQPPKALRLDLGDLISADPAGYQTLGMLRRRGTEFVGVSPYMALQLEFEQANHTREIREELNRSTNPIRARTDNTTDTEDR
jgi:hypothetical protein